MLLTPLALALSPFLSAPQAAGTCTPAGQPTFGGTPGVFPADVWALCLFDEGSGPQLFVGGGFELAGSTVAPFIARWNGRSMSALPGPLSGMVRAMVVHDDGSGPALFVGGEFLSIGAVRVGYVARWDGASWTSLGAGTDGPVRSLAVHDDGAGAALYVGGSFSSAGGVQASNIARWRNGSWEVLGAGIDGPVLALVAHDDGSGSALFAGGAFTRAGDLGASALARWQHSSWSSVGGGMTSEVYCLEVFDGGSGPELYAGGAFTQAGGQPIARLARWNGSTWSSVGSSFDNFVHALRHVVDESGPALYAGGRFTGYLRRFDGSTWAETGTNFASGRIRAIAHYDDGLGEGPALVVGGNFLASFILGEYRNVEGLQQRRLGAAHWSGVGKGPDRLVYALEVVDVGNGWGPQLYAAGDFSLVEGRVFLGRIARWDGFHWQSVADTNWGIPKALKAFDDGNGDALYVTGWGNSNPIPGTTPNIGRWDGTHWSNLGSGLGGPGTSLAVFDDGSGPALIVGGSFQTAGGVSARNIARWDGSTWSALGTGLNGLALAFAVHDDGSGPSLFVGGNFSTAGDIPARGLARWDGTNWHAMHTTSTNTQVYALGVHDDGSGPKLYAGGIHVPSPSHGIGCWDGTSWSIPGTGIQDYVEALCPFDDGTGPALFVGGRFDAAGGVPASKLARWDGVNWSAVGSGASSPPYAMHAYASLGGESSLVVAGSMRRSFDSGDGKVALWGCRGAIASSYCHGDGTASACPCANHGASGEGCANSTGQGAVLTAQGTSSIVASDLVLRAVQLPANRPGLFFQGSTRANNGNGFLFGDGLRCAGGGTRRLEVVFSDPAGLATSTIDIAVRGAVAPGQVRTYQLWYRDPVGSPCLSNFNLTNGLAVTWTH